MRALVRAALLLAALALLCGCAYAPIENRAEDVTLGSPTYVRTTPTPLPEGPEE